MGCCGEGSDLPDRIGSGPCGQRGSAATPSVTTTRPSRSREISGVAVCRLLAGGDCSQCVGSALAERPFEARLLSEWLVTRAARWARACQRAALAPRNATEADRRAQVEERLRTAAVECLSRSLLDAADVCVDRQDVATEREVADRRRRVRPNAGQLRQVVRPAVLGDRPGRRVQRDRAAVVTEPLPRDDHIRRGGGGQRLDVGPALEPGEPARDHAVDLRLLKHHLGNENGVWIRRLAARGGHVPPPRTTQAVPPSPPQLYGRAPGTFTTPADVLTAR